MLVDLRYRVISWIQILIFSICIVAIRWLVRIDAVLSTLFNALRPRQNGRHFADDIIKFIFFNENSCISINISLKFVPEGQINDIPVLVQIMARRRPGDKPLSEPMMASLLTYICVTRPQWFMYHHDVDIHISYLTWYFTSGLFYEHGLTLIPAWISNYMSGKVWVEITYPFLNFNGLHRLSLGMDE